MKAARIVIFSFALAGLLANWIATDIPWYILDQDGHHTAPIVHDQLYRLGLSKSKWQITSKIKDAKMVIWAPIPFSPDRTKLGDRFLPPTARVSHPRGRAIHFLGTDRLGRDVAAILVRGCRLSLYIALLSMLVAGALGGLLGGLAGIYGNKLVANQRHLLYVVLVVPYCIFLLCYNPVLPAVGLLAVLGGVCFRYRGSKMMFIPLDSVVMRTVEVFDSIPLLLLLLAASSIILHPSLTQLSLLIGLVSWPRFARYARAEVLKVRSHDYIRAAAIAGENQKQIAMRYMLPEVMPVFVTVFVFGLASTILLESTLSFLGIGVPIEQMSWGSLLAQSRQSIGSWWLVVFPGGALFILVFCLNRLAAYRQSVALK